MNKFTFLSGVAAPLLMVNIDTDMIIPKQHLKTIQRTGLGKFLFEEMRFDSTGRPIDNFVLNKKKYSDAKILITGSNFGCGSSREHAPWALLDFGVSCIIAPSFADIFYNNCFQNGMLPIVLNEETVEHLADSAESDVKPIFTIDLNKQTIDYRNETITFVIDAERKYRLLNGLDNIGLTEKKDRDIENFESKQKLTQPWLYG